MNGTQKAGDRPGERLKMAKHYADLGINISCEFIIFLLRKNFMLHI